jgi:SAM-dependent methyltransferase/uncharacterized protein YbaR (Trm112 family)
VRRSHFEALRPVCAVCRSEGVEAALGLAVVTREQGDHVLAGALACPSCGREYPILDGIPILVAEVRRFVADSIDVILARDDLDPYVASLLGDALGPGAAYDVRRSHLSSYGWGHWGDQDPNPSGPGRPAGLLRALQAGLDEVGSLPSGPILDAGCALGRSTFELARRFPDRLVLGIDASFSFLREAGRALREGRVRYPLRRVGVVYDERAYDVDVDPARVDFWIADAQSLPLPTDTFSLVTSLNLIDCVSSPRAHLEATRDALVPGGSAVVATPFDWSPTATSIESWIGGHSQRGPFGDPVRALDALLGVGGHPFAVPGLRRVGVGAEVPWSVRLHDRSVAEYTVQVTVARRDG